MTDTPQSTSHLLAYAPPRTRKSYFYSAIKWVLFAVVLAFVIRALAAQFALVQWSTVRFEPVRLIGAAVCLLVVPLVQLLSYRTLLSAYTTAPPFRVMAAVAWIPPLGKYVPGKVASVVGAVVLLRRFQIPAPVALSVVLVMDGLAVISGLITGSPLLHWVMPHSWAPAIAFIAIGIACLHPAIFGRLLNFALIRLRRQPLDRMPQLKLYLVPVLCAFSQWVLAGMALWLVADSVGLVSVGEIPRFISIAGLGYTISYLALFAPGGLGPRELIFQQTMKDFVIPTAMSAVAVVAMRIIQTITELTAAAAGLMILRRLERDMERS